MLTPLVQDDHLKSPKQKDSKREQLAIDIENYLKRGGTIKVFPLGVSAYTKEGKLMNVEAARAVILPGSPELKHRETRNPKPVADDDDKIKWGETNASFYRPIKRGQDGQNEDP